MAPELFWSSSCSWRDMTSCRGPEKGNCALEKCYLISSLLVLLCPFLLRVKLHEPLGSRWLLLLVTFLRTKEVEFFAQKILAGQEWKLGWMAGQDGLLSPAWGNGRSLGGD